jgi:hypothetical protein
VQIHSLLSSLSLLAEEIDNSPSNNSEFLDGDSVKSALAPALAQAAEELPLHHEALGNGDDHNPFIEGGSASAHRISREFSEWFTSWTECAFSAREMISS